MKDLTLQKKFTQFCESLSFPVLILDLDMSIISANSFFLERYQLLKADVIHKKCYQILFHSEIPCRELECPFNISLAEKKRVSRIKKTIREDAPDFYEDLVYSPVFNDSGEVDCIVATIKDITRSKHMEADLKKTKDFLEKIIESSGHAIVVADMKGIVILMNESARRLFGHSDGVNENKVLAEDHHASVGAKSIMEKLRSADNGGIGKLNPVEIKVLNSSGEEIPVEMTASIIYEDGEEIASMAIFQDLRPRIETERRLEKARVQLVQSDKLASVGRLAAGVAHEINNPLGGIIMYSHLALEDVPEGSMAQGNLRKIVTQAQRCKGIVRGLLDFSRQHEPEIESLNINDFIRELLSLVETQSLFQNIEIIKVLNPNLPPIQGDKSQLQQVFINCILNAAEAMEGGGKLTVSSCFNNGFVEIDFTDTGCGIPPEDREKIFEPFFTTKSDRNGTGLGLAVSHGIVAKHGGTISFDSSVNEGTTFTIRLPISGA